MKKEHSLQKKLKRKKYEKELYKLQVELCKLQEWVVHKGLKVLIVFEGRDGAGKGGGTILLVHLHDLLVL